MRLLQAKSPDFEAVANNIVAADYLDQTPEGEEIFDAFDKIEKEMKLLLKKIDKNIAISKKLKERDSQANYEHDKVQVNRLFHAMLSVKKGFERWANQED